MSLKVEVIKEYEGAFTIVPEGAIDSETYSELEIKINSVLSASTKLFVFDMQKVNYICSMGLGVIFKTKETLEKNGGSIIITSLQPQVKKVFDILKALPQRIFKNMEEVDAYITQIQRQEIDKEWKQKPSY
jgi:anti-sigma B factor antagonist